MPDTPLFKDLYELSQATDAKIEKVTDRLGRMEKGFIFLTAVIASPKLGGPDAASLVTGVVSTMATAVANHL